MSDAAPLTKFPRARFTQLVLLGLVFALVYVSNRGSVGSSGASLIAGVGLLLLSGTLVSELVEAIGIPHLTGYLAAGIAAGPYALNLVHHDAVAALSPVNGLALSLIALAGGAELKIHEVRKGLSSLAWATLLQSTLVLVIIAGAFTLLRPFIPFVKNLPPLALFGVALLWGVLAITRSPSACLGILAQLRPKGPLTTFSLNFIMSSDVVVVVMMAATIAVARPLLEPNIGFSLANFSALGHELLGSIALGTTLGLVLATYLRLVGKQLLLVLLVLGFGLSEVLRYLRFEALLTFMVAGFVVQNLTRQGPKLLHAVEQTGGVVYVVFFATAGADLDVPLLRSLWPVALALCSIRTLVTYGAARLASRIAGDPPLVRRWGWAGLVSQAGLALGLALVIEREFPAFGGPFRALAIATVAINELVGPVLFKLALDRTGETSKDGTHTLPPPPPAPSPFEEPLAG